MINQIRLEWKTLNVAVLLIIFVLKIIDVETNTALGPNKTGEICVRGPLIMKGYIGNHDATADIIDEEGWLHTGDLGHYDEDGFFYITDRKKELIKYKGYQVSPTELEQILLTHPDVDDVAVGPVPDEAAGEIPKAYVVRKSGSTITEGDIVTFLHGNIYNNFIFTVKLFIVCFHISVGSYHILN